ncbi:MAG: hypothetical protein M3169_02780 [Candidatus Eremiobacteraeota bacterium]|nr:hypothetical protein [Candidatus Eremiobacteraeota bacterium]
MIASLAGRRIDAAGVLIERFPPARADLVAERIAAALTARRISTLVCAAACGADLLALDAARRNGIAARIILPYGIEDFRRSSVADRGVRWTAAFDRIVGEVGAKDGVRNLGLDAHDPKAYSATNHAILDEGLILAGNDRAGVVALVVWDGAVDGRTDYTADFADAASARGIEVASIPILG